MKITCTAGAASADVLLVLHLYLLLVVIGGPPTSCMQALLHNCRQEGVLNST